MRPTSILPRGVRATGSARLDGILASVAARRAAERGPAPSLEGPASSLEGTAPSLDALARGERPSFRDALLRPGLSVIAECKRRSPSAGALAPINDVEALCREYAEGGAAALSILTERDHFHGALADLGAAARTGLPCLQKDFVLDEGMLVEAARSGASAALLLVVCLEDALLRDLHAAALELGLVPLVEVHDEAELERALALGPECVGVNARDLTTFRVDLGTVERLLPRVPEGVIRVAESGVRSAQDAARARAAGADAVLVGEALVRSENRAKLIAELRASEARHGS